MSGAESSELYPTGLGMKEPKDEQFLVSRPPREGGVLGCSWAGYPRSHCFVHGGLKYSVILPRVEAGTAAKSSAFNRYCIETPTQKLSSLIMTDAINRSF